MDERRRAAGADEVPRGHILLGPGGDLHEVTPAVLLLDPVERVAPRPAEVVEAAAGGRRRPGGLGRPPRELRFPERRRPVEPELFPQRVRRRAARRRQPGRGRRDRAGRRSSVEQAQHGVLLGRIRRAELRPLGVLLARRRWFLPQPKEVQQGALPRGLLAAQRAHGGGRRRPLPAQGKLAQGELVQYDVLGALAWPRPMASAQGGSAAAATRPEEALASRS